MLCNITAGEPASPSPSLHEADWCGDERRPEADGRRSLTLSRFLLSPREGRRLRRLARVRRRYDEIIGVIFKRSSCRRWIAPSHRYLYHQVASVRLRRHAGPPSGGYLKYSTPSSQPRGAPRPGPGRESAERRTASRRCELRAEQPA